MLHADGSLSPYASARSPPSAVRSPQRPAPAVSARRSMSSAGQQSDAAEQRRAAMSPPRVHGGSLPLRALPAHSSAASERPALSFASSGRAAAPLHPPHPQQHNSIGEYSAGITLRAAEVHCAAARAVTEQLMELERATLAGERRARLRSSGWLGRIERFLRHYDPQCAASAEQLLLGDRYDGNPELLLQRLEELYGPEAAVYQPPPAPPPAPRQQPPPPAAPAAVSPAARPAAAPVAARPTRTPKVERILELRLRAAESAGFQLRYEAGSLVVCRVDAYGAAAEAGMREGDEVLEIDDRRVLGMDDAADARQLWYRTAAAMGDLGAAAPLRIRVVTQDDQQMRREAAAERAAAAAAAVAMTDVRRAVKRGPGDRISLAGVGEPWGTGLLKGGDEAKEAGGKAEKKGKKDAAADKGEKKEKKAAKEPKDKKEKKEKKK
eukprot:TRINITY_DN25802_c0_g1_i1.p1 TRINITY_DN25802_c0_g1~~TRINITY_DN25802_c0_g1_i1.p1  ORF type:complete len:438 (+),score=169.48 TRINITY_DN25802_c0_g1_i1:51-1364(+)